MSRTYIYIYIFSGFPGGSAVKNLPVNAGDAGDIGSIPGSGNCNLLQYLAWEIPRTDEPGRLQFMRTQRVRYDLVTKQQHYIFNKFYIERSLLFYNIFV